MFFDLSLFLIPFLFVLFIVFLALSNVSLISGRYSYLFIFILFNLGFSAWFGTYLVAGDFIVADRLKGISKTVKNSIYIYVSFAVFIQLLLIYCYSMLRNVKPQTYLNFRFTNSQEKEYKYLIVALLFLVLSYSLIKYFIFYPVSPLIMAIKGDIINAALVRADIQKGLIKVDLPYISKVVFFLSFYCVIFAMILKNTFKTKLYTLVFLIALLNAILFLTFDGQKGPVLTLILMMCVTYLYLNGLTKSLFIYLFGVVVLVVVFYSVMLGGESDFFSILLRVFDRVLTGQNQAMYFFEQYYSPNLTGVFSDFYFSGALGLDEIKPDEAIVGYIYSDTEHLVNANTFYLGEVIAFFSSDSVWLFSFIVSFIIIMYMYFFDFLIKKNRIIYWPAALIFFSTLPINQSLQFIIYQKFYFYFIVFALLPLVILRKMVKIFIFNKASLSKGINSYD